MVWRLSSFSQSRDIIGTVQILNASRHPDHAAFKGDFVLHMLELYIAYMFTKFDHFCFRRYRDMVGAH